MRISVYQLPEEFAHRSFSGMNAVVIDVLRACSSIVAALENGCRQILPVETVEQAFSLAGQFPPGQILLAGERNGK
ncbi:2-phosphosulfolactate phosphatase, partial [candidate division KSB1 bacterium]|nr:2-phosphosulfolactate phosphatase [candidate division KSB1 bacterium]